MCMWQAIYPFIRASSIDIRIDISREERESNWEVA